MQATNTFYFRVSLWQCDTHILQECKSFIRSRFLILYNVCDSLILNSLQIHGNLKIFIRFFFPSYHLQMQTIIIHTIMQHFFL